MGKLIKRLLNPLPLKYSRSGQYLSHKKAMRICVKKMKNIPDPESSLCRAVLINNTLQTLKILEMSKLQCSDKLANIKAVSDDSTGLFTEMVLPKPLVPEVAYMTDKKYEDLSERLQERL